MGKITIKRPQKFGGNLTFDSYLDLEKSYLAGSVHPQDLKNGTASALHELFQPFQKACDSDPEPYNKLTSALD